MNNSALSVALVAITSVFATATAAQDKLEAASKSKSLSRGDSSLHSELEEIIITSHPLSGEGLSQAVELLQGDELQRSLDTNIGSTLGKLPGIQSAGFGKAVGRPIIHGLGGARVRIMEDRIDTMDLSSNSADHAVGIDPFIAEKVEVLKGASSLLYGSGAIGGVVDIHTGRIPHSVGERALSGGIELRRDFNTDGNAGALKLNGGQGNWAWHFDGSAKDGNEYDIPDFAESSLLRAAEEHEEEELEGEEDHAEEEEARGTLPGSQFDSNSFAFGASYLADWGFVGAAVSQLSSEYGLPGGHGHEEEEGEEEEEENEGARPLLDMEQQRLDLELGVENPFLMFSSLNVRAGFNDYEHSEIEPSGEVATEFANKAWEARAELVYELERWNGAIGLQLSDREFSALGEEAFIPPVDTDAQALFWLAETSLGWAELEMGARIGQTEHQPQLAPSTDFNTYALSAGLVVPINDKTRIGVIADLASRAPMAEELYSNGPHLVSNSFELGDASLDNEKAANVSATLEYSGARLDVRATAYYTQFDKFIYQQATGAIEDDLPVLRYRQGDAKFYGIDFELDAAVANIYSGELSALLRFDYVRAQLDSSNEISERNIPRTPPQRLSLGLNWDRGPVSASIEMMRVFKQDDIALLEFETAAYTDISVWLAYDMHISNSKHLQFFLQGKNLSDDEQRQHTSFIKEFAPAPGRTVVAGLRFDF